MEVEIDVDMYDEAFSKWVISIFGRAVDEKGLSSRFDNYLGLCHDANIPTNLPYKYTFRVTNEKRYFLAKIKYGF
jgi:hypothetical protein